ncbi:glycosyltransferase family 2 protein [Flavobacterium sp. ZT3R25]|uniref:glycosyltransferase family 2 protein n=1 Tax=Flavobacterium galactosi TaxID=3398735 RepID=UPI003A84E4DD
MNNSLVSIIVPCYNQVQYLNEALQSVLEQTYIRWECIIVDDGSPDNTQAVAKQWVEKDSRFVYLKKENGGLSSARNYGIEHATGEFILPLDADDKIAANYVALAVQSFQEDTSLKVVYCKADRFGDVTGIWQLQPFSLLNLCSNNMIFCSAMFRKRDWKLVGGYDVKMLYGWEDWEFWIAILKNGGGVKCLDEVGFYYRIKSSSMVKQLNEEKRMYLLEYMSIKHVDFFIRQLGSFTQLNETLEQTRKKHVENLKSEKFVIDAFCTIFFGFSIFGLYKNKKQ